MVPDRMTDTSSSNDFELNELPDPEPLDPQEWLKTIREARFGDGPECVDCSSRDVTVLSRTTSKGAQKYQCQSCERYFNTLSDTIFSNRKMNIDELVFIYKNYAEDPELLATLLDRDAESIDQFINEATSFTTTLPSSIFLDNSVEEHGKEYRSKHDSVNLPDAQSDTPVEENYFYDDRRRPSRNGYILTSGNLEYLLPDCDPDVRSDHMEAQIEQKSDRIIDRLRFILEDLTILATEKNMRFDKYYYRDIGQITEQAQPDESILLHQYNEISTPQVASMCRLGYAFRQLSDPSELENDRAEAVDLLYGFMLGLIGTGSNSEPLHHPGEIIAELKNRWRDRYSVEKNVITLDGLENPEKEYAQARTELKKADLRPTAPLLAFIICFDEFEPTQSEVTARNRVGMLKQKTSVALASELADAADEFINEYRKKNFSNDFKIKDVFENLYEKEMYGKGTYMSKSELADELGTTRYESTRAVNHIMENEDFPQPTITQKADRFKLTVYGQFVAHHWLQHNRARDWIHRAALAETYDNIGGDSAFIELNAFRLQQIKLPELLESSVLSYLYTLVSSDVDQAVENRMSTETEDIDREQFRNTLDEYQDDIHNE